MGKVMYACLTCGEKISSATAECGCDAKLARIRAKASDLYAFLKLAMTRLPKNCAGIRAIGQSILDDLEGK